MFGMRAMAAWALGLGVAGSTAFSCDARAESQPLCPAPTLFVGNGRVPVDAFGVGVEAAAPVWIEARVERLGADGGAPSAIQTVVEPSDEPACRGEGHRARFVEPLEVGERYALVVDYGCDPPYVVPPFGNSGTQTAEFVAIAPLSLPSSIDAPSIGELRAQNHNGCSTDARAYTLALDPVAALVPEDAGADIRGVLTPELRMNGACVTFFPVPVDCPAASGSALEMQWVWRIPHAGVMVAGETASTTIDCDAAVDVSECGPTNAAPASEAPSETASGSESDDGGCSVVRGPSPRSYAIRFGWILAVIAGALRRRASTLLRRTP